MNDAEKLRRVAPIIRDVAKSFDYNPGHSDLDDEQPITFTCRTTLGALRWARAAAHYPGIAADRRSLASWTAPADTDSRT